MTTTTPPNTLPTDTKNSLQPARPPTERGILFKLAKCQPIPFRHRERIRTNKTNFATLEDFTVYLSTILIPDFSIIFENEVLCSMQENRNIYEFLKALSHHF
ncbi:CDP-abequose synthase [Trichinella spiralis]|uniref:CDP-abequose synthase n=1 Tax=Trichinella spiralis TaxID=6334 RepID=A0ABR3KNP3_TRISP